MWGYQPGKIGSAASRFHQTIVPEEHLRIARHFNAGFVEVMASSPEGTAELNHSTVPPGLICQTINSRR
jgi:hypothetical protein